MNAIMYLITAFGGVVLGLLIASQLFQLECDACKLGGGKKDENEEQFCKRD